MTARIAQVVLEDQLLNGIEALRDRVKGGTAPCKQLMGSAFFLTK